MICAITINILSHRAGYGNRRPTQKPNIIAALVIIQLVLDVAITSLAATGRLVHREYFKFLLANDFVMLPICTAEWTRHAERLGLLPLLELRGVYVVPMTLHCQQHNKPGYENIGTNPHAARHQTTSSPSSNSMQQIGQSSSTGLRFPFSSSSATIWEGSGGALPKISLSSEVRKAVCFSSCCETFKTLCRTYKACLHNCSEPLRVKMPTGQVQLGICEIFTVYTFPVEPAMSLFSHGQLVWPAWQSSSMELQKKRKSVSHIPK